MQKRIALRPIARAAFLGTLLAIVPDAAFAGSCRMETVAELNLSPSQKRPMVEGALNGYPLKAELDTGSSETLVFRRFTEANSLQAFRLRNAAAYGIGGRSDVYRIHADELKLGSLLATDVDLDVVASATGAPPDAVIGVDILFSRDLELSLASHQARMFHLSGCDDVFLAYWNKDALVVPLRRISSEDERRTVTVRINGTDLRALIDTGADRSMIDTEAARNVGLDVTPADDTKAQKMQGVGPGQVGFVVVPVKEFAIGPEVIHDTKIAVSDMFTASVKDTLYGIDALHRRNQMRPFEMYLGQDFLMAHRVLFSVEQKRFYFSYVGGRVFDVSQQPPAK